MQTETRAAPLVAAHRGTHGGAIAENTFAAFEAAVSAGAEMIELDVRRSADGELVILHDRELAGVELAGSSLDQFAAQTGLRPPRLRDVLDWALGRIALDVELKEDHYAERLATMLTDFRRRGGELIVTSFLDGVLAQLAELAPELERGLLVEHPGDDALARAASARSSILVADMQLYAGPLVGAARERGLEVILWDYMAAEHGPAPMRDPRLRAVITDDVAGALAARA